MEMDNSCELIFNIYPNNKTYLQRREIIAEKIRTIGDAVGGRKKKGPDWYGREQN